MSGRPWRAEPKLLALLLRFYPRAFRDRFARAMSETFAEDLAEARELGRYTVFAFWARAVLRIPFLGLEEHVRSRLARIRRGVAGRAHGGLVRQALDSLTQDVRFALRALWRTPGFALVTIVTVGLGVGATTALFSLMNTLLLRPLPVSAPHRLVSIQEQRSGRSSSGMEGVALPYARYEAYEEATRDVFSGLAAQRFGEYSMRVDAQAFPVGGVVTSGNFFEVLGVRPQLGRFYGSDDEAVIVLGHRLWQQRFGGSPDVIGRTVHLNGRVMTVVGVAAREFGGTVGFLFADFWLSYGAHVSAAWPETWLTPFGRLRPGVELEAAAAVINAVAIRTPPEAPGTEVHGARLEAMSRMPSVMSGAVRGFLGMLVGTALLVLLIASANIAGMMLSRSVTRRREVAVRLALGARRGRVVRQLLTESVLLFLLGGVAGIVIAFWGGNALTRLRLPVVESMPLVIDATPDWRVLASALALAGLTGILSGLLPAVEAARASLVPALKDGGRTGSTRGGRARGVFVAAQVAMSVFLLIVAGLFVRTVQHALRTDPGFAADGVVIAATNLAPHDYDEGRGRTFYQQLIERVRALPEVESASLAHLALLTGESEGHGDWRRGPAGASNYAGVNTVDASYFETMRVPLVAGRGISAEDVAGAPRTIVVNQTFAERLWPGENPVGREILWDMEPYLVVGVTRDGKYALFHEQRTPFVFLSAEQRYSHKQVMHVRMRPSADAAEVLAALRAEVAALDADVAVERAMPLAAAVGFSLFPQRFAAALVGSFGALGLLLAGLGVYGVLAQVVAQRSRELGIRVALGADARDLLRFVAGRGVFLTACGAGVGLLAAAGVTRFLRAFLHGISPLDPITFVTVPLALAAVALVASYMPARRAIAVDPIESLRQD